ncbi:hypothetical protein AVEN_147510-1 [Araneus ventricosus]|uniref:Uncharacterized protein n=1 Tax=Araneus ventricosus TaxID=182803 RepID=A0A4Y2JNZ3_ARAVE|nr:hypothetical protein AVEN_147510-1 [Araneus ventricosus]
MLSGFVQYLRCKTSDKKTCAQIGVVMATRLNECISYIFINAEIGPEGNCVRRFVIPAVTFRATDHVDFIDWQACNVTPPTVLRQISSHELLKMIQDDVPMDGWDLIKFPSHTQAVERIVKLVTEAPRKRVGPQN